MRVFYPKNRRLRARGQSYQIDDKVILLSLQKKRRWRNRFLRSHRHYTQKTRDDLVVLPGVERQLIDERRYLLQADVDLVVGSETDARPQKADERIKRGKRKQLVTIRL